MAVAHLRLRKAMLLVVLLILAGGVVAVSILVDCNAWTIVGMSIIALLLFLNISRIIYPARRILREAAEAAEKKQEQDKEGNKQ
ncbi:MAG: hypothetical protein ABIH04_02370 [Planctomycetota bacterium]